MSELRAPDLRISSLTAGAPSRSSTDTSVLSGLSQACSYPGELTNCGVAASCALRPTRSTARPAPGITRVAISASSPSWSADNVRAERMRSVAGS